MSENPQSENNSPQTGGFLGMLREMGMSQTLCGSLPQ